MICSKVAISFCLMDTVKFLEYCINMPNLIIFVQK